MWPTLAPINRINLGPYNENLHGPHLKPTLDPSCAPMSPQVKQNKHPHEAQMEPMYKIAWAPFGLPMQGPSDSPSKSSVEMLTEITHLKAESSKAVYLYLWI